MVVDQDNFHEEFGRSFAENGMYGSQEHAQGFVVERDDDLGVARGGIIEVGVILLMGWYY